MKKIFYLLIPILTFFSIQTVYAYTGSIEFNKQFNNSSNEVSFNFNRQFVNWGMSHVYFSVAMRTSNTSTDKLTNILSITMDNGGQGEALCTTDNYYSYKDSTSQYLVLNYDCHINLKSNGLGLITFSFAPGTTINSTVYTTSYLIYVVQDADNTSSLVDAINNNNASSSVNALNNAMQTKLTEQIQNDDKNADEIKKEQKATTEAIKSLNDSINNSDVSGANSDLNNFTDNDLFKDSTGILAIIQAPINMLNSITSATCSPLTLPIPYMNFDIEIPCLSTVLSKHFSSELLTLLKLAINGFIMYKVLCSLVMDIHSYKDPDSDKLEVLDL